jgi:hypothetical protein
MASVTQICNRALQEVGGQAITSLTENTRNSRALSRAYDSVRLAELENHPWNFAIKRAELAADVPVPDWGRQNSFTLPNDFLRLEEDYPERLDGAEDYQIESGKIVTNADAPLKIRYVADVVDPNQMTPLFREGFALALALAICEEITQSGSKLTSIQVKYENLIRKAKKSNAIQNRPAIAPDDTWISCRR